MKISEAFHLHAKVDTEAEELAKLIKKLDKAIGKKRD